MSKDGGGGKQPLRENNRGAAYGDLGEHQKALEDYNEALLLWPEYPDAYYNLACLYSLKTEIEPCLTNLTRAIELDEENRKLGQTDLDPEWARQDERVKKLLGME